MVNAFAKLFTRFNLFRWQREMWNRAINWWNWL